MTTPAPARNPGLILAARCVSSVAMALQLTVVVSIFPDQQAAGAVTLVDDSGLDAGHTRADVAGRFLLDRPPPGGYLVVIASPGWRPLVERMLLPAHTVHVEFVLTKAEIPASLVY